MNDTTTRRGVSVVIATRSRPALLRRALRSIVDQECDGSLEVLVVFDGTDIDPLDDLDAAGTRIRTLRNVHTPGLAGSRNTGILAASHEFVAFCDDDDEWLPGKLAAQLGLIAREPNTSIVATGIRIASGRRTHDRTPEALVSREELLLSRHTEVHPSSFLARRELLISLGLVDEHLPGSYGEDYDLLLRAAAMAPVRAVTEPLVIVHWDRVSYFTDRWEQITVALCYLLEKFPEFSTVPRGRARIEGQIAFAYAALGQRRPALTWAFEAVRHDARQRQAWAALAVAARIVSGTRLLRIANRQGRGI